VRFFGVSEFNRIVIHRDMPRLPLSHTDLNLNNTLVLDPVMGDSGAFYVPPAEATIYQSLLPYCDLLLPNQFELETLTEMKIENLSNLLEAVSLLHQRYKVPHVFITSTQFQNNSEAELKQASEELTLIGSTARSDGRPRPFLIRAPYLPVYFTGTGDMFAALMTSRLRESVERSGLHKVHSWVSPDDVSALDLPLAKAAESVVASMQAVLSKTYEHYGSVRAEYDGKDENHDKDKNLRLMKAVELRVVGNMEALYNPPNMERYRAQNVHV
jgi:pyridoxine kinase